MLPPPAAQPTHLIPFKPKISDSPIALFILAEKCTATVSTNYRSDPRPTCAVRQRSRVCSEIIYTYLVSRYSFRPVSWEPRVRE